MQKSRWFIKLTAVLILPWLIVEPGWANAVLAERQGSASIGKRVESRLYEDQTLASLGVFFSSEIDDYTPIIRRWVSAQWRSAWEKVKKSKVLYPLGWSAVLVLVSWRVDITLRVLDMIMSMLVQEWKITVPVVLVSILLLHEQSRHRLHSLYNTYIQPRFSLMMEFSLIMGIAATLVGSACGIAWLDSTAPLFSHLISRTFDRSPIILAGALLIGILWINQSLLSRSLWFMEDVMLLLGITGWAVGRAVAGSPNFVSSIPGFLARSVVDVRRAFGFFFRNLWLRIEEWLEIPRIPGLYSREATVRLVRGIYVRPPPKVSLKTYIRSTFDPRREGVAGLVLHAMPFVLGGQSRVAIPAAVTLALSLFFPSIGKTPLILSSKPGQTSSAATISIGPVAAMGASPPAVASAPLSTAAALRAETPITLAKRDRVVEKLLEHYPNHSEKLRLTLEKAASMLEKGQGLLKVNAFLRGAGFPLTRAARKDLWDSFRWGPLDFATQEEALRWLERQARRDPFTGLRAEIGIRKGRAVLSVTNAAAPWPRDRTAKVMVAFYPGNPTSQATISSVHSRREDSKRFDKSTRLEQFIIINFNSADKPAANPVIEQAPSASRALGGSA
jgi:hypothetical protein